MMSIRLRLTLLYSAILTLTLIVFGTSLYTVQAEVTMNALKSSLIQNGDGLAHSILDRYLNPNQNPPPKPPPGPPLSIETLSGEQAFSKLREREIVRVLDSTGTLIAVPFPGQDNTQALPLSAEGLKTLQVRQIWWDTTYINSDHLLIYNSPVIYQGNVIFIVQVARSLSEQEQSLAALSRTLIFAGLLTILIAFGFGWILAGVTLRPIHNITSTALAIGNESDFTKRVDHNGPNDEIGQLASTFNSMLSRLQDAYQHVSQALKMQRDFVADVSHELRTPLTTIRGNLALLHRTPPLPADERDDVLTDLEAESDRLIRLVNNLLILARADAGRSLTHEAIPLRSVVEEVCRQARQLDPQREIVEDLHDINVLGDRDALKQILLILLDNAIKYTTENITITAEAQGSQALISVRDAGAGIPSDILSHIFDRFYRGEDSPQVQGVGLGLPIAKALISGQGGTITVDSQVGQGTTVNIHLPLFPFTSQA
jgi:signal transduction histidine kinase